MPGHHQKEQNRRLWQTFSVKIPKLWQAYKQLARTTRPEDIVIVVRAKSAPAAEPAAEPEPRLGTSRAGDS
jgi:hypothetical protein